MSKETSTLPVSKTGPAIQKLDTHYRRSVSVDGRLLITLREGRMYQNTLLMEAEDDISIGPRGIVPENLLTVQDVPHKIYGITWKISPSQTEEQCHGNENTALSNRRIDSNW
ncbi:hypothetical protein JTB14_004591 [Gonioctena quinquepunctata]|nr:hypothetical protein JTB14_004591 [Gonioctena quinquepunctata]